MKNHYSIFPIDQMAQVLGVSRSGYYDFIKETIGKRDLENEVLLKRIREIWKASFHTYGSPRIHATLLDEGFSCSRVRVAKLMKKNGIQAKMYKKFKKTTQASCRPFHRGTDLLQQNFSVSEPNKVWVADISYIAVAQGWCYLAIVLDLFSRKVVGMALQETMKTDLILEALQRALCHRKPSKGLIHHSDLGGQYTSKDLYKLSQIHGIRLSHGKTGVSYDNAVMESFFHTLKTEWVYFKKYHTAEEAKLDIFTYIFTFYNRQRRHSTLNYQSPQQWENRFKQQSVSVLTV